MGGGWSDRDGQRERERESQEQTGMTTLYYSDVHRDASFQVFNDKCLFIRQRNLFVKLQQSFLCLT